jgi:predicted TIM-barrel fold metal-dependent hydrolase
MAAANVTRLNLLLFHPSGWQYFDLTKDLFPYPAPDGAHAREEELRAAVVDQIIAYNEWGVSLIEDRRFGCFIGLDPVLMDPTSMMLELEDKVRRGATGVKLVAMDFVATLDDPRLLAIYDFCQAEGVPILHAPGMRCQYRATPWPHVWGHPLELANVYRQFPRLKTCFAHMGTNKLGTASHQQYIADLARRYAGVHTDVSAITLRVAQGQVSAEALVSQIRDIGVDRVLYGSNFGTHTGALSVMEAEAFRCLPLAASEFDAIGSQNYWKFVDRTPGCGA